MWDLIVLVPDHCLSFYFVSNLDVHANTPQSRDCKTSKLNYSEAGHVITANLKISFDLRIRHIT